ncbi:MAG: hypothetical protein H6648_03815 [Caldilineae bacterium]|nr:hypothetical protein [Caldilineae bacterium]
MLFLFAPRPELRDYLRAGLADRPDVRLDFPPEATPEALLARAPEADVMVGWRPTRQLLDAAPRLRLVINPGVGVQHLVPLFRAIEAERSGAGRSAGPGSAGASGASIGVPVLANGHGNTDFVAQHTVALLLALTNRILPHHAWMADGRWRTGDAEVASIPLRDRRIGLLGYGAIGSKVHRLLAAFGARFAILRREPSRTDAQLPTPAEVFGMAELPRFLDAIDVLIVAVPQTEATTGMIAAPELERLAPRGLLVNVARGPIVDEDALYEALAAGHLAGAALDVWYDEQPAADAAGRRYPFHRPFHRLPNVVLSPHRAASPLDDLPRWAEVIDNIRRVADGRDDLRNVVDLKRGY